VGDRGIFQPFWPHQSHKKRYSPHAEKQFFIIRFIGQILIDMAKRGERIGSEGGRKKNKGMTPLFYQLLKTLTSLQICQNVATF